MESCVIQSTSFSCTCTGNDKDCVYVYIKLEPWFGCPFMDRSCIFPNKNKTPKWPNLGLTLIWLEKKQNGRIITLVEVGSLQKLETQIYKKNINGRWVCVLDEYMKKRKVFVPAGSPTKGKKSSKEHLCFTCGKF